MRYPTLGDWYDDRIFVAETGDDRYNFLIAIHELVEQFLCQFDGVEEKDVTDFDLKHLDSDEPGTLLTAPYRNQHADAEQVEKLMSNILGVNWKEYGDYITLFLKGQNQIKTNMSPKVKKRQMAKGKVAKPVQGVRKNKKTK